MSIKLPAPNAPIREAIEVAYLATLNRVNVPTYIQAKMGAAQMMGDSAIRSVHSVCVRSDGTLALMRFGKRGGAKTLWTFGTLADLPQEAA